jgi:hypothetical protein
MPRFFSDLKGDQRNAKNVASWILENVPCFPGAVPMEWEQAVYNEAKRRSINPGVLSVAISLARSLGYKFTDPSVSYGISGAAPIYRDSGDTMQSVTAAEERANQKAYAEALEWKYRMAMANDNVEAMKRIAQAFADLLNAAYPRDEEIQWGAPLLRRAIERRVGAPEGGRGGSRGGPYRVIPGALETELIEENEWKVD